MKNKKKLLALLVGLTLFNASIIYATDEEEEEGGLDTNIYKCFVGVPTAEKIGERTRWCGDCAFHYIDRVTGDGTCNK